MIEKVNKLIHWHICQWYVDENDKCYINWYFASQTLGLNQKKIYFKKIELITF